MKCYCGEVCICGVPEPTGNLDNIAMDARVERVLKEMESGEPLLVVLDELYPDRLNTAEKFASTKLVQEIAMNYTYAKPAADYPQYKSVACACCVGDEEWSGSPNPKNPDTEWICDACGRVIAAD